MVEAKGFRYPSTHPSTFLPFQPISFHVAIHSNSSIQYFQSLLSLSSFILFSFPYLFIHLIPTSFNPSLIFTQSINHPHSIHQPSSLNPSSILTQSIIHPHSIHHPSLLLSTPIHSHSTIHLHSSIHSVKTE